MVLRLPLTACACLLSLIIDVPTGFALPFSIAPQGGTSLPTELAEGQQTYAFYTVQNATASTRSGNTVKYLPQNVSQITTDPNIAGLCGASFTLQPKNTAGDSCTLELLVNGAVNAQDSNPQNHLFVCFPGGRTCAGTEFPLNVALIPAQPIFVAAGLYANVNTSTYTMAVSSSNDEGATWQQSTIPIPSQYQSAQLNGMYCSNGLCSGGGYYTDSSGNNFTAAVSSTDNGHIFVQQ